MTNQPTIKIRHTTLFTTALLLATLATGCGRQAEPPAATPAETPAPATAVAPATDDPIELARSNGKPTMVSFGADRCIPCQAMKPAREAVAEKYEGRANILYVRVDLTPVLATRYGVRGIPHVIFFDAAGQEVSTHTGVLSQEQMETQLAELGVDG